VQQVADQLAGAALHIRGVLFKPAFVGIAFYVYAQRDPCLAANQ
jgi:hypothetical protein